jgi:hypothetical protein
LTPERGLAFSSLQVLGSQIGYPPTYYPASLTLSSAAPIDISPLEEVPPVDVRLVPTQGVRVRDSV